ncbi:MAG TPA: amino acid adenylation domain-containing protein, partial [Desulfurivibrionaceae bacterium]|nr:amino acid adenylation domain-containing protein [Desulfurivibrionaceae bacterium]
LDRNPLFQVMIVFQNASRERLALPGLTVRPVEVNGGRARFDLTLTMQEEEEGLKGIVQYNTDLFDSSTARRMLKQFQTLLEGIVADPERPLSALPLLTQAQGHQLLVEWNETGTEPLNGRCIHELFEAQAQRTPQAVAVICDQHHLTYQRLNARANELAHHLRARGVGADVPVGLCLERSLEMVVGILGILKAGGAYLPLDPAYPKERLAFMLEDAQAPVLLTQQRLAERFPYDQAPVVCIDADGEAISRESQENPASGVTAAHLVYVIYTSGSTGQPKGVQIPHRAVVNFLYSMGQQPGLTRQDLLLAVTTLSFDIAGLEFFLPLTVGAQVMVISREVASDGALLLARLANSGATVLQATPATWRLLLESGWRGRRPLKMLCGGENLPRELADRLLERHGVLWNLYGPTETTIWSAVHQVGAGAGLVPIGHPIANTQIYVLDRRGQPVSIGIPGELHIGGAGLARGYLDRPDLTAE